MGKIVHIDRLKGLAILVMVIGHVYLFVLNNHSGPINRMITCNMPLFMFLSGVVVSYPISPKKWLNKACRFMSPSIFIGITCFLLLHNFVSWDNTLLSVIEFFYIPSRGYWYLVALTIFYATLIFMGLKKEKNILIDIFIAFTFYILFFIGWKYGGKLGNNFCMEHCTCYYPFFIFGYLLKNYYDGTNFLILYNSIFTISIFAFLFFFNYNAETHLVKNLIDRLLMPISAIIICVVIFAKRETKITALENFLSFLGRNSLNIYVWHGLLLPFVNLFMLEKFFKAGNNILIELIIATILGLTISVVSLYIGKLFMTSNFVRIVFYGEWAKNIGMGKSQKNGQRI